MVKGFNHRKSISKMKGKDPEDSQNTGRVHNEMMAHTRLHAAAEGQKLHVVGCGVLNLS